MSTPKLLLIEPPFRWAVSSYQPMVVGISAKSANFASAVQVARIVKEVSPSHSGGDGWPSSAGEKYREGIYHYNLDAFLASYTGVFGGSVFPEVPEGAGRVDLLVMQGRKRWIVEVKRFLNLRNLEQGKRQVAAYVRRTGQEEGYLVVFSDVHPEGSRGEELVDGVRLHWWILPVNVTPPSRC